MVEDNRLEEKKYLPKVLVFGQPFNDFSGGGITLSNLYKGWPKQRIASLWAPWDESISANDICEIYYKIGRKERKWHFPFNLYKRPFPPSGFEENSQKGNLSITQSGIGVKNLLTKGIINPSLKWIGLYHISSRISLSPELKKWLVEFNPEILYFQVSSLEGILFAGHLIDFLNVPSVIHMMDDWPVTISAEGLLKKYWHKRIDRSFRILLDKVDLYLSISRSMSEEYLERYNKKFISFHNPVDLSSFYTAERIKRLKYGAFKILYIGRIGTANEKSIISFANAISILNSGSKQFEFHVYSKDSGIESLQKLRNLPGVLISPPVPYEKVPDLLMRFNLLLLPLDFTEVGLKFARLSFPTKATEYMVSGIPILVFAPEDTEVLKFFKDNNCGFCLTQNSVDDIHNVLKYIVSNNEEQRRITQHAVDVAKENFDAERVRLKFQQTLAKIVN